MRRVKVLERYRKEKETDKPYVQWEWKIREAGEGKFIQYGIDYEADEGGPGMFTTAIVEMDDGTVLNKPVDMIVFLDKDEKELAFLTELKSLFERYDGSIECEEHGITHIKIYAGHNCVNVPFSDDNIGADAIDKYIKDIEWNNSKA